jgi:prolyl oligopeptidase
MAHVTLAVYPFPFENEYSGRGLDHEVCENRYERFTELNQFVLFLAASIVAMNYPIAPKGDQVDNYHGHQIADPYRGLEDANSAATQKWVEEENALTHSYLSQLPGREKIHARLTQLWDFERFSNAYQAGGHYFYSRNSGLQNQDVVYVSDRLNGEPRVLIDPNTYRSDGTAALSGESVSWNGKLFGYGVSQAGSDWSEIHVREIATGKDLPDVIHWVKGSVPVWTLDDSGFYYSRFPEPPADQVLTVAARNAQIYLHRLGEPQSADTLVYERPDQPTWGLGPALTEDGRYLLIYATASAGKNMLFYQDLSHAGSKVVELIAKDEFAYSVIGSVGPVFYIQTTESASRGRLIAVDVTHPEKANWRDIVPEQPATLNSAAMAGSKFVLDYLQDAHSVTRLVSLSGKPISDVALPGLGTANFAPVRQSDREIFYAFATYTAPTAIYRLDLVTDKSTLVHQSRLSFNPASYETKQVFYQSKDGTRVPMFLTYRKGIKLDSSNPTLLYGYGGFDIAMTPGFSPPYIEWMDMGGIFAVANLRGGSEYGEAWHLAGTKEHKQNVFDDFIAAAEWLISSKYTSTPKLAIFGGSNGGLLVGAVVNQRPDLYGAAMAAVGVMDMLRFQKFGFGEYWVGDYGSSDNATEFESLIKYSPLHNIKKGAHYPPVLITTSDHDDRVMPGHSFKYAATLQQAQGGPAPILIRIETRAGHGAGKPVSKLIDEWTDRMLFLRKSLGME